VLSSESCPSAAGKRQRIFRAQHSIADDLPRLSIGDATSHFIART